MEKLTADEARIFAEIENGYDAVFKYLWDAEENVAGAFSSAGTKVNVSYVSFIFQNQYGQDMRSYMASFMSHDDIQATMTTLRELPKF